MEYALVIALLAAMNVTPVPLPPSWLVMAYLVVRLDLDPVGIVLAGAAGAALGRTALAAASRAFGPRLLPRRARGDVARLADRLQGRRTTTGMAALLAVSPPPSGALYTAAGLLRVNLLLVGLSCFAGRLVTYAFAVAASDAAAGQIEERLRDWAAPWPIALGLLALPLMFWLLVRAARAASRAGAPVPRG